MVGRNCCNSVTLRLILFTNIESVIGKYQTGVLSTSCYSPTDAISDGNWTTRGLVDLRMPPTGVLVLIA